MSMLEGPMAPLRHGSPPRPQLSPAVQIPSTTSPILPLKMEKPVYSSPPPASSNPENNTCKLIEYRGAKVAAFSVDGRELICLPQAFDLFLKHLVGGLHTVYTKLKRLDITPIVCNVEQVRILRGLGAIQPGVNRCKLISPKEFDVLYDDCTNSSARPGRPPKRSALATPEVLEKLKKSRMENGDFGFAANRLMDMKKSPLFTNGYHYPPHLAHMPFMPLGHPAIMNLAMANHLGMRPEHLLNQERPHHAGTDLSNHGPRNLDDKEEHSRNEYNNNNNNKPLDMDKPLNLTGMPHRNLERRPSTTDKESIGSSVSEAMTNGQMDYSGKSAVHSGNEDLDADADDESEDERDDDDEIHRSVLSTSVPTSMSTERGPTQSLPGMNPPMMTAEAPGISSIETLLMNIQGLLKVAAENARHREQQIHIEKADLKMEILKEKELRQSIEKQLMEEHNTRSILQKRLKKEKKARRRLQEQLETLEHCGPIPQHPLPLSVDDHIKQTQDNLRMLNESVTQDSENERSHSDSDRKMAEPPRAPSGIQNLMETYLQASAQPKVSTCSSTNGYLHSPVIKQTEAV